MRRPSGVSKKNDPDHQRTFSVELASKADLKAISLSSGGHGPVLVEGTIGELREAAFVEGVILEIAGSKGVLRLSLSENEIKRNEEGEQ